MRLPPRVRRRAAAALAATTFVVMASVGSCQLPQPKFPTLGATAGAPRAAATASTAGTSVDLREAGRPPEIARRSDDPARPS